jgi:hypothetical protein
MRFSLSYLVPFVPLLGRLIIIYKFSTVRGDVLSEKEQDREAYRNLILAFAGFSFTALSALAVVDYKLNTNLSDAIYYLMISFFAFMFSLNWVAYKARRWEDQIATALTEVGSLSLFLAVISILVSTKPGAAPLIAGIATFIWVFDHFYRIYLDWEYHDKLVEGKESADGAKQQRQS